MDVAEFYRIAAEFYDGDYAAKTYREDIHFYVDLARASGGPVLEMGCGTGRVLLPVARAGIRIHGIDLAGEMLAVLRQSLSLDPPAVQQRVTVTEGDVRKTTVDGRFALVTAPFRVVQHLLERQDQRAWLRNVRHHLAPGGALVFDVFQPDFHYLSRPRGPEVEIDRTNPETGMRVRRSFQTRPHSALQLLEIHFEWLVENAGGEMVSQSAGSTVMRWYTRGELENLLELEGFAITDYWGSFNRELFGEGSQNQVIRAGPM